MTNNTKPDNKDIPDNSSDQYLYPDEIGELPTQEELAEWASNIDENEIECCLTESKPASSNSLDLLDRKALERKLFMMGFTNEEISSMSDDELNEIIKDSLNIEPECVLGGPRNQKKPDNFSLDIGTNHPHMEDFISNGPPKYTFGSSANNSSPAKEDCNIVNDTERQPIQDAIPEVKEIPEGKDISAVFTSLPSGIIECQLSDIGAISLEMQTERTSVIVFPSKAALQNARKEFPNSGLFDSIIDPTLKQPEAPGLKGKTMFAVPETTETLCSLLDRSKINFFLIIFDMDILQGEASYRDAVSTMYDTYIRHPKDKRCIITSDAEAFSDPGMKSEKKYVLKGGSITKRKPEIISCKNIIQALKRTIEGIRRPQSIVIQYNSVKMSRLAILNLNENYQNECGIICNEASKEEAGEFYMDRNQEHEQVKKRITFYTNQNYITVPNKKVALIIVSDTLRGITTLSVNQIVKAHEMIGSDTKLQKDIIIHNTFYCYPTDWQSSFSAFIEKGNRISELLNATEQLVTDDKVLGRFFRPIRRTVQYKVGIKGRFQQINLLRQDSSKVWKPSYMAIDSLLVRTRLLENFYSRPHLLSDALKDYYLDLSYICLEDEPKGTSDNQNKIEKAERRKSLDRASDSRNKELDRILAMDVKGELTSKTISHEAMRGKSSKRKVWQEFQRLSPYIDTKEATDHLKGIKTGNRIGFKNLNNSIMFWALDDEHPLKQSVYSAFKAGESYSSKEIKEKMSPIIKYHFNKDYLEEDADKKDTGRKLITLFKSFMNAERPRSLYNVPSESIYQTHCSRISPDDNDLLKYFIL